MTLQQSRMFLKFLYILLNSYYINSQNNYEEFSNKILKHIDNLRNENSLTYEADVSTLQLLTAEDLPNEIFCDTCVKTVKNVVDYYKSNATRQEFQSFIKKVCISISHWGQQPCNRFVELSFDTILYILERRPYLKAETVCGIYFQNKNCTNTNPNNWSVSLPPYQNIPLKIVTTAERPVKILHLTDVHMDPNYDTGSNADCGLPLCCQTSNGPPSFPANAAGYWGDYHVCDMPWRTLNSLLEHVSRNNETFEYVYFTGDIIDHNFWETSVQANTETIQTFYKMLKATFKNTPVFPILGNHESHPVNCFSPKITTNNSASTDWLFELVANEWSRWLPENTKTTIINGGYYTVLVKPGFRIIALNSNVCYTSNLWLIYDDSDIYNQLKWLVEILSEAERNQEKVHILSHVPPGHTECLKQWMKQYVRIINRFSSIISAQFNGHTHLDEIRFFYDVNDKSKVTNVAFNGGSFASFIGLNPNYRIYTVDPTNWQVADYDQFMYDLSEANLKNITTPNWFKLYSFKQAYDLADLKYDNLANLVKRMKQKGNIWIIKYFKFQVRNKFQQICDQKCQDGLVCQIISVEVEQALTCYTME